MNKEIERESKYLKNALFECEGLLEEVYDYIDDTNGYDSDIFRKISMYFNGDGEE